MMINDNDKSLLIFVFFIVLISMVFFFHHHPTIYDVQEMDSFLEKLFWVYEKQFLQKKESISRILLLLGNQQNRPKNVYHLFFQENKNNFPYIENSFFHQYIHIYILVKCDISMAQIWQKNELVKLFILSKNTLFDSAICFYKKSTKIG